MIAKVVNKTIKLDWKKDADYWKSPDRSNRVPKSSLVWYRYTIEAIIGIAIKNSKPYKKLESADSPMESSNDSIPLNKRKGSVK